MTVTDAVATALCASYRHRCRNVERHRRHLDAALAVDSEQAVKLHAKWAAEVRRCADLVDFMGEHGIPVPQTKEKAS